MARKLRRAKRRTSKATKRSTSRPRPAASRKKARASTRASTKKARGKSSRPGSRAQRRSDETKRVAVKGRPKSHRARRAGPGEPANVPPLPLDVPSLPEEQVVSDTERARRTADAMVGDEEPGGSVTVPEHDEVDEWAGALGVERSPDSPVRSSAELLADRDRRRGSRPPEPKM